MLECRRQAHHRDARQGGNHLGGRRARHWAEAYLQATEGGSVQGRKRAEGEWREAGRHCLHLHADDAGGGNCHAGMRTAGLRAFGGVRRLFDAGSEGQSGGREEQVRDHCKRGTPRLQAHSAQEDGRRCGRRRRLRGEGVRLRAHRYRSAYARGQGRVHDRRGCSGKRRVRSGVAAQRGPPLRALHQRQHRQAEGPRALHRRLPRHCGLHPSLRFRLPPWRRLRLRSRRWMDHGPYLHRLWPSRQRSHHRHVREPSHIS
mmetsp:Transcript_16824/g.65748  ORF Transcript_16824/g.65748 Transcript_16824/m.65748 type:complete len:259 (-) Transcript_16824:964-1740(-)